MSSNPRHRGSSGPQRSLSPRAPHPTATSTGPRSRLKAHRLAAGLSLVGLALVAGAVVVSLPDGSSSKYGGLPSWLPKTEVPVGTRGGCQCSPPLAGRAG